ncbi:MAG TPA: PQQ-binding-like beta-propeller repeat protein [Actinomycetota bacterium]|nr:PQQ-binding-like beta-propeller repeat protein [Actinomycetota bacterium]
MATRWAATCGTRPGGARLVVAAAAVMVLTACSSNGPSSPAPSSGAGSAPSTVPAHVSPSPLPSGPAAGAAWTTYGGDAARSGLDRSSPPIGRVHRVWTSPALDGAIYAQPLLFRERVFVATESDSVYALDAASGQVAWRRHLGEAVPRSALPCGNIDPTGITGTPVIDPSTGVLYAVTFVQPGRHDLVALDTADGSVRFRRPIDPPGLDPLVEQQRPALTISDGRVYVAYGGLFGDCGEYHGAVVGSALDGSGSLISYRVPSGRAAGIWAPPGPTVVPGDDLLVATGNSFSTSSFDFGNAVIRLSPSLDVVDWFAPSNWLDLNRGDVDLGSTSPALLPDGLVFIAGKEGIGSLLRLDRLGHVGGEVFSARVCDRAFGGTAVRPPFVYVSCTGGVVGLRLGSGPSFQVAWRGPSFDAGPPIVSGGAVWTVDLGSGDLVALDAGTGDQRSRQRLGAVVHFTAPAAGDGHVYVAATDRVVGVAGG